MRRFLSMVSLSAAMTVAGAGVAAAGPITWTDWTVAVGGAAGTAAGTLGGVAVSYAGEVSAPTQVAGGTNYWIPDTPYLSPVVDNAPPCCDIIALEHGPSSLTFSAPVVNPILAIVSLGQANYQPFPVQYDFNHDFNILSFGPGFFGAPGTLSYGADNSILVGDEGHGAIQFIGTFDALTPITWTTSPSEYWHGFQVGVAADAVPDAGSTMLLFSTAAGLLALARRGKKQ